MPVLHIVLAFILIAAAVWFLNADRRIPQNVRGIGNLVLALIVVGVALWLINTYIPMANSIKVILNIVVVVATCVGVLQAFGLWSHVTNFWNNLVHKMQNPPPPAAEDQPKPQGD